MNTLIEKNRMRVSFKKCLLTRVVFAVALASFSLTAQSDKIISMASPTGDGFGGWNFDNIEVVVNGTGSTFNELTGAYVFGADSDFSYESRVYDDDAYTTLMGKVLAKDWPVGEPAGIKIVNDDPGVKAPKPENCIMSTSYLDEHFLDDADPQQVICSGPFQSHKRYKLAMLPTTVAGGAGNEKPIDLVFNVVAEAGSRDYQVFQKINNWTGVRLKGFTIQVGTGLGGNFEPASGFAGVGVNNLSLSVPFAVWDRVDQLANFSTGLFGPIDTKHDRPAGYFDPTTRAGFVISEYPNSSGVTDTLTSAATLGSDYVTIPPTSAGGNVAANQFGSWLPNHILPYGIFFDDDGNPDTDAELVAWYGDKSLNDFGWMTGAAGGFAAVPDATISDTWSNNPLYSMGFIDDLVNVGLNYIVTVGDVNTAPGNGTFTIRITPLIDDVSGMGDPTYVGQIPAPKLVYTSMDAIITLDPSPEFIPGSLLTARVADADLDDPAQIDVVTVEVSASGLASQNLELEELGINRGVFAASLPDEFSDVALGTIVTVTYTDIAGGSSPNEVITASSTAVATISIPDPDVPVPDAPVNTDSSSDGLFSFSWLTAGLLGLGLLLRRKRYCRPWLEC